MAITFDLSGIRRAAERVAQTKKAAETALQRAKSTVARRALPEVRRDIQTEYNLTASRINDGLKVTQTADGVEIVGFKRGVGLIEFDGTHSRRQKGAAAKVFKSEAKHIYADTFIAVGRNGNRQIFQRDTKRRLPLTTFYGPSMAAMLRKPGRAERIGEFAQKILSAEITRLLR